MMTLEKLRQGHDLKKKTEFKDVLEKLVPVALDSPRSSDSEETTITCPLVSRMVK
jgi:hypothetical protein